MTEHQKAAISDALDALNQAVNTHPNETVAKIFLAHALKKQKKEKEKKN